MSAATVPTTSTANGSSGSAVEYVRGLPPEDKQAVFLALLREAVAENGDTGLLPVDDEDGKPFGYYVPPKAAGELYRLYGPQLTEEEEQEIDCRIKNPQLTIPATEVIADFQRRLAELQQQPQ
jgi:hypothetical protein